MRKMAKFRNSKDANLVIGAVLLIAIMVVISVAVDACTGTPSRFFQPEELSISSIDFSNGSTINIVVKNNGTVTSEIEEVWINNQKEAFTTNSTLIQPVDCINLLISYAYSNGTNYHIKIVSEKGSSYLFTATAL
ncbi:hypothetical protein E2P61_06040 [Candidatus Bathyarchaeota archaeon]|nr:hypothetical protein E2P61_06040 [Candidatus Bathyarchaeota archaeon]